jgi:hypothetical protein
MCVSNKNNLVYKIGAWSFIWVKLHLKINNNIKKISMKIFKNNIVMSWIFINVKITDSSLPTT